MLNLKSLNILLLILLFVYSGCVRYTKPRSELTDSDETNSEYLAAGADAFLAYEKKRADKLEDLIERRKSQSGASSTFAGSYQIGNGDVVKIQVFGFPDLSTEAEVSAEGTISLPMLGDNVVAAGKSTSELNKDVTARLRRFVRQPQVQVSLQDYQASRISVIGEVTKPGMYPMKRSNQSIVELLSEAGGRTDKAGGRVVLVPFMDNTASDDNATDFSGVEISIDDLIGGADTAPLRIPLAAGDTIIVPEAGTVEVYGEVEKPGSFRLASRTSALGAVAGAGGFTYAAKVDEVEVIRDIGQGQKASLVLNLEDVALKGYTDTRLRDGDIVRVPSQSGLFLKRQIVDAINGTFRGVGVNR